MQALEETNGAIKNIYLSGGIIKSENWVQMLTDISGKQVMVNEVSRCISLRRCFYWNESNWVSEKNNDARMFLKNVKTFKPNVSNHKAYKKYFKIYSGLYTKLKEL